MERLLKIFNLYRKARTLKLEEEHEAIVNLFDAVSATLLQAENLKLFMKLQAFELLISLFQKQKQFRRHIVKVFDYALSSAQENTKVSRHFIESGGLSTVFSFFMQKDKASGKKKQKQKLGEEVYIKLSHEEVEEDEEHTVTILLNLLVNTAPEEGQPSDVTHERVLFKFIENNYEKL